MLALFFAVFGVADAGGATGFVGGHAVAAASVFGVTVAAVGVFVPVLFWLFDLHLLAIMMAQKLRLEFQFIKNS